MAAEQSRVPDDLRFTAEHEWVRRSDGAASVRVGITDYAQQALGDVVYVSLPEVGATVNAGESVGEIESTKSVSDLYAPVAGRVAARNEALAATPELINNDPYGEGWLIEIETVPDAVTDGDAALLDPQAYRALLA